MSGPRTVSSYEMGLAYDAAAAAAAAANAHASRHLPSGADSLADAAILALAPDFWLDARMAAAGANATVPNRGTVGGNFTAPSTGPVKGVSTVGTPTLVFASAATRLVLPSSSYGTAVTVLTIEEMSVDTYMVTMHLGSGNNQIMATRRNVYAGKGFTPVVTRNAVTQYLYTTTPFPSLSCLAYRWDGTLAAALESKMLINDATPTYTVGAAPDTSGSMGALTGTIGADNAGVGANYYQGNISHVLIFNRALQPFELTAAWRALRDIAGLPG